MNRVLREKRDEKIRKWWHDGALGQNVLAFSRQFGLSRKSIRRIVGLDPEAPKTRASAPKDPTNPGHYRDPKKGEAIDAMPEHFREWLARAGIVPSTSLEMMRAIQLMMIGFAVGNAFKYRWRKGLKAGASEELDESKGCWYDAFAMHILDPSNPDPRDARKT